MASDNTDGVEPRKKGCFKWVVMGAIMLIFIFAFVLASWGSPAFIHFLGASLLGWLTYLRRVLPQVTLNYSAALTGAFAFGTAVLVSHYLLVGLRPANEQRPVWRWQWTLGLSAMIPVLFGISIAAAGLVHQTTWLMREPRWAKEFYMGRTTKNISNARQVITALRIYASDNNGRYPEHLEELFSTGVLDNNRILYYVPLEDGTPELLVYLHGSDDSSEGDMPLVVAPRPVSGDRWVGGTNDSSVSVMKREQFEELMTRWRVRQAAKKKPAK